MSSDPLAGRREAINAGELDAVVWTDDGTGCPVKVGDVFKLRSCHIEITRVHRVTARGAWSWRAEFRRYFTDRVWVLSRGAGSDGHGYGSSPSHALRAQDDLSAPTIDRIAEMDRSEEHRDLGEPPEPEVVPPHEVKDLPSTKAARARYEAEHADDIERRLDRSMTNKLREVRIRARNLGVDVSEEMAAIAEATEQARLKVRRAA